LPRPRICHTGRENNVLDCRAVTAWAERAILTVDEHRYRFNPRPDQSAPLDRALVAAQKAVELGPSNQWAHGAFEGGFMGPDLVETLPTNLRKARLPEVSKDD